jgi:hypothetical protein
MKNVVFWDVTSCGSCTNRRFGGRYRLYHDDKNRRARNNSYDMQGYGGGTVTRLHKRTAGDIPSKSIYAYNILTRTTQKTVVRTVL